ncbi:hypothetical protein Gotri_025629 [Gossypium trilobum]|uniref:Uncharacterized protein n=2 Tax=Gossypium TaxID=3633 RepID=A0A7J9FUY3_9ROSI|nr:hypothetical protein [Gossypium trilobum]
MLENILPHAMLKAKPNLELRIRTLKMDWTIIYDMLSGKDNSSVDTKMMFPWMRWMSLLHNRNR